MAVLTVNASNQLIATAPQSIQMATPFLASAAGISNRTALITLSKLRSHQADVHCHTARYRNGFLCRLEVVEREYLSRMLYLKATRPTKLLPLRLKHYWVTWRPVASTASCGMFLISMYLPMIRGVHSRPIILNLWPSIWRG